MDKDNEPSNNLNNDKKSKETASDRFKRLIGDQEKEEQKASPKPESPPEKKITEEKSSRKQIDDPQIEQKPVEINPRLKYLQEKYGKVESSDPEKKPKTRIDIEDSIRRLKVLFKRKKRTSERKIKRPGRGKRRLGGENTFSKWGCFFRFVLIGGFILFFVGGLAGLYMYQVYLDIKSTLPSVEDLHSKASQFETTRILDSEGNLLYEILDPNAGRRTYVKLDDMSPYLIAATIATEDSEFLKHPGFNWMAIARAFIQNTTSGETVSGASTITQQLARTLLFSPEEATEQTYMRKVREALLAIEITRQYTKEEVLEIYLNENNYGNLALITGLTGVGKSTLFKLFLSTLDLNQYQPIFISFTNVKATSFLNLIVNAFGEVPKPTKEKLYIQIIDKISKSKYIPILIIDEAHFLNEEVLIDLRLILTYAIEQDKPLKMVLAGQYDIKNKIKRESHSDLKDRVSVYYDLKPFSKEQTIAYIDFQMKQAKACEKMFESEVKQLIHEYAVGIPRKINHIATACLLNASNLRSQKINLDILNQTMDELNYF